MIEQKFNAPLGFQPEQYVESLIIKVREISGVEVKSSPPLKPQVPGYNGTTYVLNGNGVKISIRYDPDAIKVDRPGLNIYVSAGDEEQIYQAIIDILSLNVH